MRVQRKAFGGTVGPRILTKVSIRDATGQTCLAGAEEKWRPVQSVGALFFRDRLRLMVIFAAHLLKPLREEEFCDIIF